MSSDDVSSSDTEHSSELKPTDDGIAELACSCGSNVEIDDNVVRCKDSGIGIDIRSISTGMERDDTSTTEGKADGGSYE